ncbi:MAG: hypothetical protein KKF44_11580, partial [Nanoarchaeota archaeon]|nr:hypothetical protein [Nanoarchaeota archaeon]
KERDGVIYNEGNKLIFQYRPDTEGAMNKTVDTWIEAVKTHYDGEKIPLDFSAIAGGFTNDVYVDALFGDYALQLYIPNGSTKQHYGTNIKTIAQKMRTELREIVDIVDRNQQVVRSPDKFRLLGIVAGEDDNSNGIVLC